MDMRDGDLLASAARSLGEAECIPRAVLVLESLRGLLAVVGPFGAETWNCASPALIPILVCTHLWNGDECI